MAIVCTSCDHEPGADAVMGAACVACGAQLVVVDTGDAIVGTVVDGRFTVLAQIGKGGMGVVYRAEQRSIGREVALKLIDRRFEQDVASVKRFFREAKLASTLAHPNTVGIIDFGQSQEGRLYLAMELVHGRTLHEEVEQQGALPLARVITIGLQLCDALEVAHGLSIVHRDLKLENVMLVDGGRDHIKILDFGLARSLTEPASQATATGLISGTPRYMPPEVVLDGAAPAPSQDMYAVGVMLAELAIGKPVWTAPTIVSLFTQKLDGTDALETVPLRLRPLVKTLLDADPAARPTAGELRASLRRLGDPDEAPQRAARGSLAHAPTTELSFPEIIGASLVTLDQRDSAPGPSADRLSRMSPTELELASRAQEPPLATTPPVAAPRPSRAEPMFEPETDPAPKLDLDAEWVAKRAKKQEAAAAAPAPRPTSILNVIAALALVGVGAAVVVHFATRSSARSASESDAALVTDPEPVTRPEPVPPPRSGSSAGGSTGSGATSGSDPRPTPAPTVAISIEAKRGAAVAIGGRAAGMTPETLYVPRGKKSISITITIDGVGLTQKVVPDRDQTVSFPTP